MTDYTTLIAAKTTDGSIKQWVNDSTIPSASIVTKAEAWIYQYLRCREMMSIATGNIAATVSTLAAPTGLLEPIAFNWTDDYKMPCRILDQEHFESRLNYDQTTGLDSAQPSECMVLNNTFYFNHQADQTYYYRLVYFGTPTALATAETNFLTDRYPHMLEAACYYWAFSFKKDRAEANHWMQVAQAAIDKANDEAGLFMASAQYEKYWSQ